MRSLYFFSRKRLMLSRALVVHCCCTYAKSNCILDFWSLSLLSHKSPPFIRILPSLRYTCVVALAVLLTKAHATYESKTFLNEWVQQVAKNERAADA